VHAPVPGDQPLGLTVHTMPVLSQRDTQRTQLGRWKMLLVLAICAAPVLASYLTYYWIRPEGRRHFGDLIDPQRPLPDVLAHRLDGSPLRLPSLRGQWLLISVASGACDTDCQAHLYLQRQLRESLGKEKDKLDWVWLIDDLAPVPERLQPALQQATVLRVPSEQLGTWLVPAASHRLREHLYLVDPLGHWMMRFPAGLDLAAASKARRDMERLLRAAASWDEPGR